jgi:outer membrane protein assembly factor BamB
MPSPLLVGKQLYIVSDSGVATCLDAKTGRELWQKRLGGSFAASPVLVGGRIYFFNRDGETTVILPAARYEEIAKNKLDGSHMASAAIAGAAMFLRTDKALYRIESPPDGP